MKAAKDKVLLMKAISVKKLIFKGTPNESDQFEGNLLGGRVKKGDPFLDSSINQIEAGGLSRLRKVVLVFGKVLGGMVLVCFSLTKKAYSADKSSPGGLWSSQKSSQKKTTRWTLEEWLAQKDRNRMMDLWLGMYAPSPYEFYLAIGQQDHLLKDTGVSQTEQNQSLFGQIGAYATILGVTGEYQNNTLDKVSDTSGALNLRVAGNAVQGTHLIAFYGNRNRKMQRDQTDFYLRQNFYGGDLNLYLNKWIGLSGRYLKFIEISDSVLGTIGGDQVEVGLFIDFENFRIEGRTFKEVQKEVPLNSSSAGSERMVERLGSRVSLQLFF